MIRPLDIAAMLAGPIIVAALVGAFLSTPAPPPVAAPPSALDTCPTALVGVARPGVLLGGAD